MLSISHVVCTPLAGAENDRVMRLRRRGACASRVAGQGAHTLCSLGGSRSITPGSVADTSSRASPLCCLTPHRRAASEASSVCLNPAGRAVERCELPCPHSSAPPCTALVHPRARCNSLPQTRPLIEITTPTP